VSIVDCGGSKQQDENRYGSVEASVMAVPAQLAVLAHSVNCDGGDCPTFYSDGAGNIGIQGATEPGAKTEHIAWMSVEEFRYLFAQLD
jgi:hypothetical protein